MILSKVCQYIEDLKLTVETLRSRVSELEESQDQLNDAPLLELAMLRAENEALKKENDMLKASLQQQNTS